MAGETEGWAKLLNGRVAILLGGRDDRNSYNSV
jgi:hypothetical protein